MLYKVSAGYSGSPFPVTELPWVLNHIQIPGTPGEDRTRNLHLERVTA